MTDEDQRGPKAWVDDAEEAISKATEALKAAWEGTREARMATLEAAKDAASQLGHAIDQGIEVAKDAWDPSRAGTAPGDDDSSTEANDTAGT
ncbi:MAG: hypothetical protein WBM90_04945 [Acidimicrobiia bacterium]